MTFTLYLEWQCPKCHAVNHTDPKSGTAEFVRTDYGIVFGGSVPAQVTCAECKAEWLATKLENRP